MSDEVSLPPLPGPDAGLEEMRAALRAVILWAGAREPAADGDTLDKFITNRAAVGVNLLEYTRGGSFTPPAIDFPPSTYVPPAYESDYTPPTPIAGLTVTPGIDFFLVEFDAPTYTQGGGNAYTDIYQANYSGTGPLPTFADAVPVFRCMGALNIAAIPTQPGTQAHFWVGAVTRSVPPTRQVDGTGPTGGTNGVSAQAGQDVTTLLGVLTDAAEGGGPYSKISFRADLFYIGNSAGTFSEIPFYVTTTSITQNGVTAPAGVYMRNAFIANGTIDTAMIGELMVTNAKIASMSVAKLTAGSIAVGEYIQSTGFVTGISGWKIDGNGNAEFNGIVARGNIYAPAALIQGLLTAAQINANGLTIKNTGGDVLLYAGAGATPPWVVNGTSIGGGIELTTGVSATNTVELRSIVQGDGMDISVTPEGAVKFSSKSSDDAAKMLHADVTRSATSVADVTDFLLPLEANAIYRVECLLMYRADAATTGLSVGITLPSSAEGAFTMHTPISQTALESRHLFVPTGGSTKSTTFSATWAADAATPSTFSASVDTICRIDGIITTGAGAGSMQLGFASEVSGSVITLRKGSALSDERIRMLTVASTFSLAGSPGFDTVYSCVSMSTAGKPRTAALRVTLDESGGWSVARVGTTSSGTGSPTSGSWSSPTGTGAGSQWLVKFETVSTLSGEATISNGAPDFQSLASPRSYTASVASDMTDSPHADTVTVAIKMRNAATGSETTLATIDLEVEAETT